MADIKIGAKSYSGIKKLNFPLSDGSGYAQFSQGGGIEPLAEYSQMNPLVAEYMANVTYDPSDYTVSSIDTYAGQETDYRKDQPAGKALTIKDAGTLQLCGGDVSYDIASVAGANTVYNLIPMAASVWSNIVNDDIKQSGSLKPKGSIRMIKCSNARNVRDLGGWACDGGTVKYGKLFRGGAIDATDRDALVNQCGVMHELSLLGKSSDITESPLGNDIGYTKPDEYNWYTLSNTDIWKEVLQCIFDCAVHNIPLYFHCVAGRDRTGTVACIIEAILGVSQSDIDKDYELTCFSLFENNSSDPLRTKLSWSGTEGSGTIGLITQINAITGETFRDKAINFVASLGFTADEINAFRVAMIDGTPETVIPDIDTFTVTNNLVNVSNDNDSSEATEYQPYYASIVPDAGYVISELTVTLDGKDITGDVFIGEKTDVYLEVTLNLENCKSDFLQPSTMRGQAFVTSLTANNDYTLEGAEISITMGGVDVSTCYSNGKIAIPKVTGNIVITAKAIASAPHYQQCEWISNEGNRDSYIDTGYINTEQTGLKATFQITVNHASGKPGIVGNNDILLSGIMSDSRAYWGGVKSYQLTSPSDPLQLSTDYTFECNYLGSGVARINGTDKQWNAGAKSFAKDTSITMFKANGSTVSTVNIEGRISELYITEGSEIVKHYVAAYRSTDGACGMYDTISGEFIVGIGTFTKGADVA